MEIYTFATDLFISIFDELSLPIFAVSNIPSTSPANALISSAAIEFGAHSVTVTPLKKQLLNATLLPSEQLNKSPGI